MPPVSLLFPWSFMIPDDLRRKCRRFPSRRTEDLRDGEDPLRMPHRHRGQATPSTSWGGIAMRKRIVVCPSAESIVRLSIASGSVSRTRNSDAPTTP